jgi:deoxyribose-phosphate aldolase
MKLTHIAILAVKGSGRDMIDRLADVLGVTDKTIYKYISDNSDELTKAAVLKVIREETGLTDDQILEETESVKA